MTADLDFEAGATLPLTPEARGLDGASGQAVTLSDGREWLLADAGLAGALDGLRDRLDDQSRLRGTVGIGDAAEAAFALLLANYELTEGEAAGLIVGAEPAGLVRAVMAALFGPERPRRTYSTWASSALWSNGVDPATVPPAILPQVLEQLVLTRRAVPADAWIDSAVAAPKLARWREKAERQAAERRAADGGGTPAGDPAP